MKIKLYILCLIHSCNRWIKRWKLNSEYVSIGKNLSFGKHFRCEPIAKYQQQVFNPKIIFGNNVHIEDFVHIGCTNRIEFGDNTVIASRVYISDHNHGIYDAEHSDEHENPKEIPPLMRKLTHDSCVKIGKNVWIGENVTILPGSVVGDGAIIGANSVVKGALDEFTISVGTPAKSIKKYNFETGMWVCINEN